MDPGLRAFLLGCFGSFALEAFRVVGAYQSGRQLPARYRRFGFWTARTALALVLRLTSSSLYAAKGCPV
jgi:hypothetical protein